MKKLNYYVLDVFTNERYKGNQLAVVEYNDTLSLSDYHRISREFGYSETSFVHYSTVTHALMVRSFTAAGVEVEGAGHNLLGAVCLALMRGWDIFKHQQGQLSVMIKDIRIPVKVTEENGLPYVAMKQQPAKIIRQVPVLDIAIGIGLKEEDLYLNGWAISVVETEVAHLMIPVKNTTALYKAAINKELLIDISLRHGFEGFYLFTTNTSSSDLLAETRFFNPGIGIDEDPATGTAAGPLAGYLEKLGAVKRDRDYLILQGTAVKHPSTILVHVSTEGIWVSGSSVIVMEGTLYLD